jgi:dimethylargininase
VRRLPAEPDLPDSVFVEDCAVVLDEMAIVTRPGAESRRPETASVTEALRGYRPLRFIQAPGTIDGGDVLRVGRSIHVGISDRSNADGIAQLRELLLPFSYSVEATEMRGCLHLKTAVTLVAEGTLLVNPSWVDANAFTAMDVIEVDPREPFGANGLRIGNALLYAADHERTEERLRQRGIQVHLVNISELAKAEAGVTCCSIIFES